MAEVKVTKDLENKQLIVEHTFDAPLTKLWRAYTDKDWFEKWWGPEGWTTTTKEFSTEVGGRIHYAMKCVDEDQGEWFGKEAWGVMVVESIEAPNSISFKDYFADETGKIDDSMPAQRMVIELTEAGGKTTLRSRSIGESAEDIEKLLAMGMVEGFSSSVDKLDALVTA